MNLVVKFKCTYFWNVKVTFGLLKSHLTCSPCFQTLAKFSFHTIIAHLQDFKKNYFKIFNDTCHRWQCHGVHSFEYSSMICNKIVFKIVFNFNSLLINFQLNFSSFIVDF
jgi:hypothetical protein